MGTSEERVIGDMDAAEADEYGESILELKKRIESLSEKTRRNMGIIGFVKYTIKDFFDFRSQEEWNRDEGEWVRNSQKAYKKFISGDNNTDCL